MENNTSGEHCVQDSGLVRTVYGYWPSFHDAQLTRLDIELSESVEGNTVNVNIGVRHKGQDNPNWVHPGPDFIVEFRFMDISDANIVLSHLSAGGWIDELVFKSKSDGRFEFSLIPSAGVDMRFDCSIIRIVAIHSAPGSK
jgi:hypothetical protein